MLADSVEHADEAALIARQHGDETAQRIGERADELGEEFDLGRQAWRVCSTCSASTILPVDIGRLDAELLVLSLKVLSALAGATGSDTGEDDAGRTGENDSSCEARSPAAILKSVFLTTE